MKRSVRIEEATDEASERVTAALGVIERAFARHDRQALTELRSELAEKRLGLLSSYDFHFLIALDAEDQVIGTIVGAYLEGVNCGFVTHLAVEKGVRSRGAGRKLRDRLVELFRENARAAGREDLDYVLGEIRSDSPWLRKLIRAGAIPFELQYFHPGMSPDGDYVPYTLYREPVGGAPGPLSIERTRRIVYSIYRRAYRVRYPLERPGFRAMLDELDTRMAESGAES